MIDFERLVSNSYLEDPQKRYLLSLTEEQRAVVEDESRYALVTAAAGSGKTRVLVAKYLWLTRVVVKPRHPRIIYLSFNRKNVNETRRKMLELGMPKNEAEDVTSTFHSLALKVIESGEGAWPRLLEGVKEAWDESWKETWSTKGEVGKINHDAAEVFLKELESNLDMEHIREVYVKEVRRAKGYPQHRYVCYAKDRNGIPGSCRSEEERDIFHFLVQQDVDFAYEEYEELVGDRVDFTIFFKKKDKDGKTVETKVYYEHFAAENAADFDGNVSEEDARRYAETTRRKIREMEERFGNDFFYTTSGNDFRDTISRCLQKYEEDFTLGSCRRKKERNGRERVFDSVFEDVVSGFKDVRGLILETGQRVDEVLEFVRGHRAEVDDYIDDIFLPIEKVYRRVIGTAKPVGPISDFADSVVRAAALLGDEGLRDRMGEFVYDWVLVDEYQDISQARLDLIKGLRALNPKMRLLAVGDDWQTINSFAGSDVQLFRRFDNDWEDCARFQLSETFRFGGPALAASTAFARATGANSLHDVRPAATGNLFTEIGIVSGMSESKGTSWQNEFIDRTRAHFGKKEQYLVLSRFKPWRKNEAWMTMHKAKGADVDYVFVKDCHEGALPCNGGTKNKLPSEIMKSMVRGQDIESIYLEERRLFYVAITRARKKVWLLHFADKEPSPFLGEIGRYLKERGMEGV